MNRRDTGWIHSLLAGAVILCLPLAAQAQDDEPDNPRLERELSEDLRVMSALVDDTVGGFYQKFGTANCMSCHTGDLTVLNDWRTRALWYQDGNYHKGAIQDWHFDATPKASNATYFPGLGAVIQLTAPELPEVDSIKLDTEVRAEPLSRWEKMRRQLQGNDDQAAGLTVDLKAVHLSRSELASQLVQLLAESGHNFRNLSGDERMSISITFEQGAYATSWRDLAVPGAEGGGPWMPGAGSGGEGGAAPGALGAGGGGGEGGSPGGGGPTTQVIEVANQRGSTPVLMDVPLIGQLFDAAKERPLPVRLTIIAAKSQIDAVAAGDLSMEDFRKLVQVNVINPHRRTVDE